MRGGGKKKKVTESKGDFLARAVVKNFKHGKARLEEVEVSGITSHTKREGPEIPLILRIAKKSS